MHTQTHRHFVAAPAMILMLAVVAVVHISFPLHAQLSGFMGDVRFAAEDREVPFAISWNIQGLLRPRSTLLAESDGHALKVVMGEVLLRAAGPTVISVAEGVTVHIAHGSFFVLRTPSSSTTVALTQAMVLDAPDGKHVLVPGQQLVFSDGMSVISPVPTQWLQDRQKELKSFGSPVPPPEDDESTEAVIARVLAGGMRMDASALEALLMAADGYDSAFDWRQLCILALISQTSRMSPEAESMLVSMLTSDPLIVRSLTVSLPSLARFTGKPLPEALVRAWGDAAVARGLADPIGMHALIRDFALFPKELHDAGFPKQAMIWRDALTRIAHVLSSTMKSAALEEDIAALQRGTIAVRSQAESRKQVPETNWTEEELAARTRESLLSAGVLFAGTTTLKPNVEDQNVRVENVFIAQNERDVPFAFTFDPVQSVLFSIVRDGIAMPNAVSLSALFKQ